MFATGRAALRIIGRNFLDTVVWQYVEQVCHPQGDFLLAVDADKRFLKQACAALGEGTFRSRHFTDGNLWGLSGFAPKRINFS